MKRILQIVFLFLICNNNCRGQVTFQKTYNVGGSYSEVNSFQITSDGGYILTGQCSDTLAYYIFLLKLNSDGDTLWCKIFGGGFEEAKFVVQCFDGGYAVCGYTAGISFLLKTDSVGNIMWLKKYDTGNQDNAAFGLVQTADSGFVFCGSYYPANNSAGATFIKTDQYGNVVNTRKYGTSHWIFRSISETSDQGFIFSGETMSFALQITKRNSNGTSWSKDYDGTPVGVPTGNSSSVSRTVDGGYIVACGFIYLSNYYDFCLIKLDSLGVPVWSYAYGGTESEVPYYVEQTSDGGYIASGGTRSFGAGQNGDLYVIKVDSMGTLLWSKTYGGVLNESNAVAHQTNDGGYAIGSGTSSFDTTIYGETYFIKTDAFGNSGCNENNPATLVTPITLTYAVVPPLDTALALSSLSGTSIQTSVTSVTNLCFYNSTPEISTPQSSLTLSPNPATSQFAISSSQFAIKAIEICNLLGEKMYSSAYCGLKTVDCTLFPEGIYFVTVINANGERATEKLVLMK